MNTDQDIMEITYTGDKGPLFGLSLKTGILTILTLGIYRFWQKTRIRKYIWSSVNAGGDTFEYTGTGVEKFLGFLVAIVFLAIYVGIIQMALFYAGINIMVNPEEVSPHEAMMQILAIYITFFAVLPFLLFAIYRARRYKMARTRWRGIRFGMEKGAWGYVLRALGYGLLAILTLGILTPLQTFKLEKYMADRSYYGTARFEQQGKWTELFPAMKHILIGIGLLIVGGGLMAAGASGSQALIVIGGIALVVAYFWLIFGSIHYGVQSFAYLTRNKVLNGEIRFAATQRTGFVIKTYILGGLLVGLLASVAFGIVGAIAGVFIQTMGPTQGAMLAFGIVMGIGYIIALVLIQALSLVFITQPILAHYITNIGITNAGALNRIAQREAETGVDAEGFADALDVGGAI
ncbi:YjgN family protein [Antarctobacter jejuensis]|uniref:YjgN family protein n=1 Tax=Antarctobacter jejuensis TaxID=1439938 RepID=UPI003FD2AFB7